MALVTAAQFDITPNALGAIASGQQYRANEQAMDINEQNALLAQQQAAQQQEIDALARVAVGGQGQGQGQGQQNTNQALIEILARDPARFEQITQGLGLISDQQKQEAGDFAFTLQNTPYEQRQGLIEQRAQQLQAQGRNPKDTIELLNLDEAAQNATLKAVEIATLPADKRIELMQGPELTSLQKNIVGAGFEPGTVEFQNEILRNLRKETGTKVEVGLGGAPLTPEAQIELAAATKSAEKQAEVRAKSRADREATDIQSGTESARVIPVFSRSLELLDDIETGGAAGAALKAKQFLGVESADEGELVNALNQQVLMQLKPIFGAQFTKAEGDWLKAIEASESKSTEANKRLLKRGLALAKKRVEIGIKAAEASNDYRAAQEMQDFIDFDINKATENPKELTDDDLIKSLGL